MLRSGAFAAYWELPVIPGVAVFLRVASGVLVGRFFAVAQCRGVRQDMTPGVFGVLAMHVAAVAAAPEHHMRWLRSLLGFKGTTPPAPRALCILCIMHCVPTLQGCVA